MLPANIDELKSTDSLRWRDTLVLLLALLSPMIMVGTAALLLKYGG